MNLDFVKLSKHNFANLVKDDVIYARLLVLTRDIGGGMRDLLKNTKKSKFKNNNRTAILARIGNKTIGWGLINTRAKNSPFNVFVAKNYRRCGIGTLIIKAAKHIAKEKTGKKKLTVFPQDNAGWLFYEKNKVKVEF
jgi:GNAT superfamily N-acetyltransferase